MNIATKPAFFKTRFEQSSNGPFFAFGKKRESPGKNDYTEDSE